MQGKLFEWIRKIHKIIYQIANKQAIKLFLIIVFNRYTENKLKLEPSTNLPYVEDVKQKSLFYARSSKNRINILEHINNDGISHTQHSTYASSLSPKNSFIFDPLYFYFSLYLFSDSSPEYRLNTYVSR